jgi:hypothetical protein
MTLVLPLLALCLAGILSTPAQAAGDDHGHDHGGGTPAVGPAQPRFAAVSEAFELVGVLDGKEITLYLDRAADNTPVTDAHIELEIGDVKLRAAKKGEDAFQVVLASAPTPGVLAVTATVTVGSEVDLLAGELDVHGDSHAGEAAHARSWREYLKWVVGAGVGLAALAVIGRRLTTSRRQRVGSTA